MKRLAILALALFAFATAEAQRITLANDSSFATTDTTAWVSIHGMRPYSLVIHAADSFNVSIRLDFRSIDAAVTVFQSYNVEADSTNSTNAAGFWKGYALRYENADNIPGAERVRLVVTKKTTLNGTTTPTYDAWFLQR